jgi:hypothetical protein
MASTTTIRKQRCGLLPTDFRKVSQNGLGDSANAYAHSMCWFQDHIYVGTTRANLANRALQIAKLAPERLKGMWPVRIPKTYWENDLRAEIWRHNPRSGEWSNVYTAPWVKGIEGFDVPFSVGFRAMAVFQGESDSAPALYVPTWASHQTPSSLILRSENGTDFHVASEPGSAIPDHKPRSIRDLMPIRSYLVACPVVGQSRFEPNVAGHMVLLASKDPARGPWVPICEPGFGDPNNVSVFQMAAMEGHFYAGTMNINEGFQIWKTDGKGSPPFQWKKVIAFGGGRGRLNQIAMSLCTFDGALYVGTAIQNCSFDYDYNIGPAAPEVLRIHPDDTWDLIVGEPRKTPQGLKVPSSGMGPGFSNPFVGYIWSMAVHDGWLYAGTGCWTIFLRYRDLPDDIPNQVRNLWKVPQSRLDLETMLRQFGGAHLWRTRDGVTWLPVTKNGFGNSYNLGVRTLASTPFGLFVGTANPFGPEVAVQRLKGWRYEANPNGGLEVWRGTTNNVRPVRAEASRRLCAVPSRLCPLDSDVRWRAKQQIAAALVNAFFATVSWKTVGYWGAGIREASAACENLIAELFAFLPDTARNVVNVGGGDKAVLEGLARRYPGDTVSKSVDGFMRRRNGGRQLASRSISQDLSLAARPRARAFDHAVWVDGLQTRNTSLSALLRRSASALRQGGTLVCFETLRTPPRWRKTKFSQEDRYAATIEECRRQLVNSGFREERIIDVSACLTALRKNMLRFVALSACAGKTPDVDFRYVDRNMFGRSHKIVGCVFLIARKEHS